MSANYRFRVQPVRLGSEPYFQLRVGLNGDRDFEFVPAHRTAFAECVDLEVAHRTEAEAKFELTGLLEWLERRQGSQPAQEE